MAQVHPYYETQTLVGIKQEVVKNELIGRFFEFRIYPEYREEVMIAAITHERIVRAGFITEYQIADLEFVETYIFFETASETLVLLDKMIGHSPAEQLANGFDYAFKG